MNEQLELLFCQFAKVYNDPPRVLDDTKKPPLPLQRYTFGTIERGTKFGEITPPPGPKIDPRLFMTSRGRRDRSNE